MVIAKETRHGRLVMLYGVPEASFKFALRDAGQMINLTEITPRGEKPAAHLEVAPHGKGVKILSLSTHGPEYKDRSIASALIAYLKTRKRDIYAGQRLKTERFFQSLGFGRENGLWKLPANKPLSMRRFEFTSRKFYIFPYKTRHGAGR